MAGKRNGFTLIELMIVVAIIAIIAAIAIPSLMRSRISSNEAATIATLRTLATCEEQYKNTEGAGKYIPLFALCLTTPPMVDSVVASGHKSGYNIGFADNGPMEPPEWRGGVDFWFYASPQVVNKTGVRFLGVRSDGVIRFSMQPLEFAPWKPGFNPGQPVD